MIGPQYASSKSAMHGLIHWLSLRYCKEGIVSIASSQSRAVYRLKERTVVDKWRRTGIDRRYAGFALRLVQTNTISRT